MGDFIDDQDQIAIEMEMAKAKAKKGGSMQFVPSEASKAISGAVQGAEPYEHQKPDLLSEFNNTNNQKMAQENIEGAKAMVYGIPKVGPMVGPAIDKSVEFMKSHGVPIEQTNATQDLINAGTGRMAPVAAESGVLAPDVTAGLGIVPRIAGAGADAAIRASDAGESPTGWGLAGAAMQAGGEGIAKGVGKLAQMAAPRLNGVANSILSKFLGMTPEDIARLSNSGELDGFIDALRMGGKEGENLGTPVLKPGMNRQESFNAATTLAEDARRITDSIPATAPLSDMSGALLGEQNVEAAKGGIRRLLSPSPEGQTSGMRTGLAGLAVAGFEATGGQRLMSTAGLGAKETAQHIVANPQLYNNLNKYGGINGKLFRGLQMIAESDNPDVEFEVLTQSDPEFNQQLNEVRKEGAGNVGN